MCGEYMKIFLYILENISKSNGSSMFPLNGMSHHVLHMLKGRLVFGF